MNKTCIYLNAFSRPYFQLPARIILGGLLLAAGAFKVTSIDSLAWEIEQYDLLPGFLVDPFAMVLPYAEIVIGALILVGLFTRAVSLIGGLLALSFTISKLNAIVRGLEIDICPCFGPAMPLFLNQSLVMDVFMLASAAILLVCSSDYLSLSGWLKARRTENNPATLLNPDRDPVLPE